MTIYVLVWSFITPNAAVYNEAPHNFKSLEACTAKVLELQRELDEGSGECIRVDVKRSK